MEVALASPVSEQMTPNMSLPDVPLQFAQPNGAHGLSLPSPNAVPRSKNTFYGRLTGTTVHSNPKFYAAGAPFTRAVGECVAVIMFSTCLHVREMTLTTKGFMQQR